MRGVTVALTLLAGLDLAFLPSPLQAQSAQSPFPTQGQLRLGAPTPRPRLRFVNLVYQGRSYPVYGDSRDEQLLRSIYGPDWQQSLPYRSARRLSQDQPAGALLDELQGTHGSSAIVYNIPYRDEPDLLHAGERIYVWGKDPGTGATGWQNVVVQEGDSLDRLARRYGTTVAAITAMNADRFNVWPHAREYSYGTGFVTVPNRWTSYLSSDEKLDRLLVHEGAHTTDRVAGNLRHGDYGTIEGHSYGEVTNPRTAWVEGWAEYNEALVDPGSRSVIGSTSGSLYRDPASGRRGDPVDYLASPTHDDYLASESTVAEMFLQLDDGGLRRDRIHAVMTAMNDELTLSVDPRAATTDGRVGFDLFLGRYVRRYPGDSDEVLAMYDATTRFTADDEHFRERFGVSADAHLARRDRLRTLWEEYQLTDLAPTPESFLRDLRLSGAWPDGLDGFRWNQVTGGYLGEAPDDTTSEPLDPMLLLGTDSTDSTTGSGDIDE